MTRKTFFLEELQLINAGEIIEFWDVDTQSIIQKLK